MKTCASQWRKDFSDQWQETVDVNQIKLFVERFLTIFMLAYRGNELISNK
ncbi:hypothetical protein ENTCAN_07175 [Enterobacter cancerogenus ATCC 35316]|nr:hypothetical protein ENTCAN_07175 [Enterobacter cancerogenus ATCC 35316]